MLELQPRMNAFFYQIFTKLVILIKMLSKSIAFA